MPCRGCFGPPPGVIDQGAKLVSAIASIYQSNDEEEIARMLGGKTITPKTREHAREMLKVSQRRAREAP